MIYLVFDSTGVLRCISQSWPMARSALDALLASCACGIPRLEIHPASDYLLEGS